MSFKEVQDLATDTVVSLGGINKKTGKKNPTSVEGYFLGKRKVEDRKKKSGFSYIYVFQTANGNIGVWGKTDLDRKMEAVLPGVMTRATFSNMRPTPNGEMYVFKVEVDADNSIEVLSGEGLESENSYTDAEPTTEDNAEEDAELFEAPTRQTLPKGNTNVALATSSTDAAARQAKVQALLKKKG